MMSVSMLLLQPIQRIMKYPLLLREILKHTPDAAKDKGKLIKALAMVEVRCTFPRHYVIRGH
jgi:hypothetical protein